MKDSKTDRLTTQRKSMITIYRKLRRNFLEGGKIQNYLVYALGEILLVMLGILLALQVNNWNEQRKEANQEDQYLMRLKSEIQLDTLTFSKEIKENVKRNQSINLFTELLKDPESNEEALVSATSEYLLFGWFNPHFTPSTSTFDDLESTGKLNIIKNERLRKAIVELYASYNEVSRSFVTNLDWVVPIDVKITSETDILKFDPKTSQIFENQTNLEKAGEIRKNKVIYLRNAATHFWSNDYAIESLSEKKSEATAVIKMIEKELAP